VSARLAKVLVLGATLALAAGCAAAPALVAPRRVGAVVLRERPAGGGVRFVGATACRRCHEEAFAFWRGTRHAASLRSLGEQGARNAVCLRCHATGFGDPLGYRGAEPELGMVGCEACHGPGADHAFSRYPELVPTAAGSDCPPCEANRVCRGCHTPERSPSFDLGRDLPRVACPAAAARPGRAAR
jgi:hypothetical protein